jgi:hypothetical protein
MAVIKIKDLGVPGSMLFSDSESYLNELTEDELSISGGKYGWFSFSFTVSVSVSITFSITL